MLSTLERFRRWRCALLLGALLSSCSDDDGGALHAMATPRGHDGGASGTDGDGSTAGRDGAPGDSSVPAAMDGGSPPPPAAPCDDPRFAITRVQAWPGGGLQLGVAAMAEAGGPRDVADLQIELLRSDATSVAVDLRARPEPAGLTALLVVPSDDSALHAQQLEAARAFVQALPPEERVAIYLAAPGLPLVAELSERREHVLQRLSAITAAQPDARELSLTVADVAARLRQVAVAWGPLARTVVVVGSSLDGGLEPAAGGDEDAGAGTGFALPLLLRDGVLQAALAAAAATSDGDPVVAARAAGTTLARRIAAQRAAAGLLGACGPFAPDEPLVVRLDGARCELRAPALVAEWMDAQCDAGASASDDYPFADVIELQLTAEQLALHDQYAADKSEAEFQTHVVLGDSAPIEATAHFRGQTSLDCERKSYSVNLKGEQARRLAPGIASDEFYLISMCKDTSYVRQVLASKMMQRLGLFPLDQRYVQLRVGGVERGVYLLLEKPEDTLLADNLALAAVVRRRLEADGKPADVKYPESADGAAEARAQYEALAATIAEVPAEELDSALSERFDLDGYLSWLAVNSYLRCGDSADEAFFYGSREYTPDGEQLYFRQHGWDADDLFRDCHHDGQFAVTDPAGLLYCAESNLDPAVVMSTPVHDRFIDSVEHLISVQLAPDEVAQLFTEARDELFARLQDEAVCRAMSELLAELPDASCAQMRDELDRSYAVFEGMVRDRAVELHGAIEAWRMQP